MALELQEKAIAPLVNKDEKIYKIFYLNAIDKPINIKNAQDYDELNKQIANNKQLIHPTLGLKIFIIPIQGDSFLHRFSLGGEREVELNQQLWKLLFTDNNYITKLREEQPINKQNIDSDNIDGMRELLNGQLKESLVAADVCNDDDNDNDDDDDEKQPEQLKLDEFSIVERISEAKSIKNELQGQAQKQEVRVVAKQNGEEQQEDQIKQQQEREHKFESQSDLDEQDIRLLVRQKIDREIRALIQQQFQHQDQDIKFDEMENMILSKLFIKRQDSEIDSIPPISFQEVNYSQIKEADIEFILNPFQNDKEKDEAKDEEEEEEEDEEEEEEDEQKQAQDKQKMKDEQQVQLEVVENEEGNQEMMVKKQMLERQAINNNQEKEDIMVKKSVEYPIYPQGIIIQPAIKPQIIKVKDKEDDIKKPEKRQFIPPPPSGMIFQPQYNYNKQLKNELKSPKPYIPYYNEQVKAVPHIKPSNPPAQYIEIKQKKKGFFDKLKRSAAKFLNAFNGDENQQNKRYKWAPMQMAAIIRHLSPQTDLLVANAERVNNQKFIALPKKHITKRVKLINLSGHKWPNDVQISKVKGDKEIILEDTKVNMSLNPGQEGMIQIPIKTPKKEGLYKCIFSLKGRFPNKKQLYFGELMGVQILVKKEQQQDYEQKLYEDAEILVRENLGTFEECLRSIRCNKYKLKNARKDLMLKFKK